MIILFGSENCVRCDVIKDMLKNKNISFEYQILDKLDKRDFDHIVNLQVMKFNVTVLPIIYDTEIFDVVAIEELMGE